MQTVAANEDLARIRYESDADYLALTGLDKYRYEIYCRGQWVRLQNSFSQYRLGVLDENFWRVIDETICQVAATAGGAATFAETQSVLDADFVEFVQACNSAPMDLAAPG